MDGVGSDRPTQDPRPCIIKAETNGVPGFATSAVPKSKQWHTIGTVRKFITKLWLSYRDKMASNKLRCGCNLTLHFVCGIHKDGVNDFIVKMWKDKFPSMTLDWVTGYGMGHHGFETPRSIEGDNRDFCLGYSQGKDEGLLEVGTHCPWCKDTSRLRVNARLFQYWKNDPSKPLIQECFPDLSLDDRERLITGTCKKCWDKLEDL